MKRYLREKHLRERLRRACREAGSQTLWAAAHGVSDQYVSDILKGRRGMSATIAGHLGFRRVTVYARLGSNDDET